MSESKSTELTNEQGSTVIQVDMKYAPRDFGEIACWSWISHSEPSCFDSRLLRDAGFGRHRNGAVIVAMTEALTWAAQNGHRSTVILTDSVSVANQINGLEPPPEGANDAYRTALQAAQTALQEAGGLVAWISPERNAARKLSRENLVELIKEYLLEGSGSEPTLEQPANSSEGRALATQK